MRWTHLIRFSESHTGYAVYRPRAGNMPERLEAVGDDVHAAGQTVAVFNAEGGWLTKGGTKLHVLTRPSKGQAATPQKPHRLTVWVTEFDDDGTPEGLATLCIPWILTKKSPDDVVWERGKFAPTCDDISRRLTEQPRGPIL